MLAIPVDVGLHRRDEIFRILPGEARHARLSADPALAMTRRAGDDLAARAVLVGADGIRKILRVLTGKARPGGHDADTVLAVTAGTDLDGAAASCGIADQRSRRPLGDLAGIIMRNAAELGVTDTREHRAHQLVFALAVNVGLHRRDEIVRILSDKTWRPGPLGDPTFAVTRRAADPLQVLGAWTVAGFALEFSRLGLGEAAH